MTDRMTNAPDSEVAQNVTTIGHLFNDKEMQGPVPKEDQGTPESVKEKIKAAMDKVVTVQVKADDEEPAGSSGSSVSSNEKKDGSQTMEKEKKASFSLPSIVSKITGKEESHENTAAPSSRQGKPTEAASSAVSSTPSSTVSASSSAPAAPAAAAPSVKKDAGHTKAPAKQNVAPLKAAPPLRQSPIRLLQ